MSEIAPTVEAAEAVATVEAEEGAAAIEEEAHRIRAEEVEKGDTEGEGTEEGVGVVIVPTEEGVGVEEETVPTEVAAGPATEEGEEGAHLLPPGELGKHRPLKNHDAQTFCF